MAETFLFSIAERVLEKIVDLSVEQVSLAYNVNSDLKKLEATMTKIKAVLLDAERQQQKNENLRLCMWKLREIFYDAEDVIDDFKCESLRKQADSHPNRSLKVRFPISCILPFSFSFEMGHKIKKINQRLDELATDWNRFNLGPCNRDDRHVFHRETHSSVISSHVFGRDVDKQNIIDLLMKPSEDRSVPVIPIVGIGGLGKTTLARLVYNDGRVTRSFPLKIWICVSVEFDLRRLLKLIIQSINGENCDHLTLEALRIRLQSLLNDKFLLILDDVWNENQKTWNELRDLLISMGGSSQSKIIVTTRSLKVASIMSSIPSYELNGLPHKDSLTLFKKWAFPDGDGRRHPNLMTIGEEIVQKCKGVPLAVTTLASLLFLKTDESDWVAIRDSDLWTLEQGENDILSVLKLSYNHLPSHLQQCFAFLSLYKKDDIYRSDEIIQLWMANGLVERPKQNQEWEDVGNQYLNELLSRCLIQKHVDHEFHFTFKMHDLIHDLALVVSQKECKTVNCQTEEVHENVRHISFCDNKLLEVPQVLKKLKKVRTVIVRQKVSEESKTFHESLINLCVSNFQYLRALKLPYSRLTALPNSIGTLKHLRHLDLFDSYRIQKLPSSFYKLRSLQSLRIFDVQFMQIPDSVQSLIELRHLQISTKAKRLTEIRPGCWTCLQYLELVGCTNLKYLPEGMQSLTSLRTLLKRCYNLVSLPRSLKFLPKLEDLRIDHCNIINLAMEPEEDEHKDIQLSLKTLSLENLHALTDLPRWLLQGSSSTLQQLRIVSCPKLSALPEWLQNLTSLQKLEIINCGRLSVLPEGMYCLTKLRQLKIQGCPKLSMRYGLDGRANWHKIAHIPEVFITEF